MKQEVQQQATSNRLNKIIRRAQGGNAFSTTTPLKRLFTLASFVVYFAIICFLLFKIGKIPTNIKEVMAYSWLAMMISFIWYVARITNKYLHISFSTVTLSYLLALIMNAYVITFIFLKANYVPTDWKELINQYYWWIPVMGFSVLWKVMFAIFEYRSRPYFGIQKGLNAISGALTTGIIIYGGTFIKKYVVDHNKFDYLDVSTFFGLTLMVLGGIFVSLITIANIFYFHKYSKIENKSLRIIKLWSALLHIGPVAIWFLVKGVIMGNSQNFHLGFKLPEIVFLAFSAFGVLVTLLIALSKKEAGGSSKVFLLTSTSMIVYINLMAYFCQIWWDADPYTVIVIALVSLTLIITMVIVIEPEVPRGYAIVYGALFASIALYALILWLLQDVALKGVDLPFHIYDIIFLIPVALSVTLEGIALGSYWWTISRISKYSAKTNKPLKVKKNKKGVTNE